MVEQLETLLATWRQDEQFQTYCDIVEVLPEEVQVLKEALPKKLFVNALKEVHKYTQEGFIKQPLCHQTK
jgi:hypothetical protein